MTYDMAAHGVVTRPLRFQEDVLASASAAEFLREYSLGMALRSLQLKSSADDTRPSLQDDQRVRSVCVRRRTR